MATRPTLFKDEDKYDSLINKYIKLYNGQFSRGLELSSIKGVISQESGFNPNALRYEANVNQYSMGMMQILPSTARGIGWNGSDNLLDPETNLKYGMKFLYTVYVQYKTLANAFASYNAGSPKKTTSGKFINQFYVDIVSLYAKFYYMRDITKDWEMATLTVTQIKNRKQTERDKYKASGEPIPEGLEVTTQTQAQINKSTETLIIAVVLVSLGILFINLSGKGKK